MKPDIIVAWPDNCDYPLWRRFIKQARRDFNAVIIIITKTNKGYNFSDFVKSEMGKYGCTVMDSPEVKPGEDWRDVAVNWGLKLSISGWVWFTEQDFYPKVEMWKEVQWAINEFVGISAVYQEDRMHPCCIFALRSIVDATRKDFGVVTGVSDHFSLFQEDVKSVKTCHIPADTYEHLNGLSSNFTLISGGQLPNYQPERFKRYIIECLECGEPLHPEFEEICKNYLNTEKMR